MTMKICCNYPQSTDQSDLLPLKLNIKLKTHSLTSLNVPLETFVGFKTSSSSFDCDYRKTMAGSVDCISEIRQQPIDVANKPLINTISSNQQQPPATTNKTEWRPILNHRFPMSTTSLNDSIARLRHKNRLSNQSLVQRKPRLSLLRRTSIPKFTFRDLPSDNRSTKSSKKQYEQSSQTSMFTSLPEIRSFVEQNCIDHLTTINDHSQATISSTPYWEKSDSWSWKSNDVKQLNQIKNERRHHIDDHLRSNLPVIIESPLRQRPSLQILNQNHHEMHRSNFSFRLYQKNPSVSRYPSTPLLACSREKHLSRFPSHSTQLYMSPLATFDDDADTDSFTSDSTFRSCTDSVDEYIDVYSVEEFSSHSDSDYSELFDNLNFNTMNNCPPFEQSHSCSKHLCTIQ